MLELEKDYVNWKVKPVLKLLDRGNYAYRIVLFYPDGTQKIQQKSGFPTKREAEEARQRTIGELTTGTYIVNGNLKLAEFLEHWLEFDIRVRVRSANTFSSYSQMVKNHICPMLGRKRLSELTRQDIYKLYHHCAARSVHIARQVKTVMNVSFSYAVEHHLLTENFAEGVSLPKQVAKKPYHTRNIDTRKTLTMEQIQVLLDASKDTPIHMQVLFNVLMGLRRQEINGVKYSDVDYINRVLSVERQLGKELSRTPYSRERTSAKAELGLKTTSSQRQLPIPDIVFEAILEQRKIYEKNREQRGDAFVDSDYICCSNSGRPRSTNFHWRYYKELLRSTGLPNIRWHDLRSTYCTLLLKEDFSPKAVSRLMGHAKEIITLDVYGDKKSIIPEDIPELLAYMDEVVPKKEEGEDGQVLDAVVDVSAYLPE